MFKFQECDNLKNDCAIQMYHFQVVCQPTSCMKMKGFSFHKPFWLYQDMGISKFYRGMPVKARP